MNRITARNNPAWKEVYEEDDREQAKRETKEIISIKERKELFRVGDLNIVQAGNKLFIHCGAGGKRN